MPDSLSLDMQRLRRSYLRRLARHLTPDPVPADVLEQAAKMMTLTLGLGLIEEDLRKRAPVPVERQRPRPDHGRARPREVVRQEARPYWQTIALRTGLVLVLLLREC